MEISITRALVELKLIQKKIDKEVENGTFITMRKGAEAPHRFKSIDEFNSSAQSSYDKITDLIDRYRNIKSKIILSNAVTEVTIGTTVMTVAEAIEKKNSINFDKFFLNKLKNQYGYISNELEDRNRDVELRLDSFVEANLGKDSKIKKEEYEAIAEPFLKRNKWEIIDPLNLKSKIESLEKEIDEFISNVDFALSESNARTMIELDK